jgi:hypothetical protein
LALRLRGSGGILSEKTGSEETRGEKTGGEIQQSDDREIGTAKQGRSHV